MCISHPHHFPSHSSKSIPWTYEPFRYRWCILVAPVDVALDQFQSVLRPCVLRDDLGDLEQEAFQLSGHGAGLVAVKLWEDLGLEVVEDVAAVGPVELDLESEQNKIQDNYSQC